MNRRMLLGLTMTALLCTGVVFSASQAPAQKSLKEQITGTWIAVSNDSTAPDGKKSQLFGPNPKGILLFDATGQYSQIISHPDLPHFKINNRQQGTPEENTAAVRGTTATFGTWTIDEASKTITVRNVGGLFPNQAGTDTKRLVVSVTADELKLTNPLTASGMRSDNVWRRAK
jgi:lipocalin-like protein